MEVVEASMKAWKLPWKLPYFHAVEDSVEVISTEAFRGSFQRIYFHGSFHESFHESYFHETFRESFHESYFHGSFRGSKLLSAFTEAFVEVNLQSWKVSWK